VKLIAAETESLALSRWLSGARPVGSSLLLTEVPRAVARRADATALAAATATALASVQTVSVGARLLRVAAALGPPALRSLDALHLATALAVGPLAAFVCYDARLADAAREQGLPVVAPA